MAQQVETKPLKIQTGHDGTHVVTIYSSPVTAVRQTEAEVLAHIKNLQGSLQSLAEHQSGHAPRSS